MRKLETQPSELHDFLPLLIALAESKNAYDRYRAYTKTIQILIRSGTDSKPARADDFSTFLKKASALRLRNCLQKGMVAKPFKRHLLLNFA